MFAFPLSNASPKVVTPHMHQKTESIPFYQEIIEEGVADGSIKTEYPKLLSQLITFLTNFWTLPMIYPASIKENMDKLFFIKEITEKMGIPLLDNETIKIIMENTTNVIS